VWRKALWALPDRLQPRSEPSCTVRVLNPHGDIVHDFYGVNPGFANPTAVCRIAAHAWKARPVFARTSLLQPVRNSVRSGPTAVS
jgi:hypothetical protein